MTFHLTELCPDCGNLRTVCSNPESPQFPQRSICYASAARTRIWRLIQDKHGSPDPKSKADHFTDGLSVWTSPYDLTPDDTFEGALGVLPAQQPNGDEH